MLGVLPGNPLGRVVREARLSFLPIEWGAKYPKVHIMRWIVVGTVVAILTGNLPLSRLNPFGPEGFNGLKSQMGNTMVSIAAYPIPLTIAVSRWVGREASRVCEFLNISCDIDPGRNLDVRVRNPIVRNGEASDTTTSPRGTDAARPARARAP